VGQRRLGIGVDRNASLDEESAARSGGIAGCRQPASEREYTDLDRMAQKSESSQVQQFFESLDDTFHRRAPTRARAEVVGLGEG
jgi:hypothetical protein